MLGTKKDLFIFITAISAFCYLCLYVPYKYPKLPDEWTTQHEVLIPSGATAAAAARQIVEAGVTDDARRLSREMASAGIDRRLMPGLYTLRKSSPAGVVRQLLRAKPVVNKVTLIPGSTFERAAKLFGADEAGISLFEKALADNTNFYPPVLELIPEKTVLRAAYLLPETYFISPGKEAASEFVKKASEQWYKKVGTKLPKEASRSWLFERGILASMVEGEARIAAERPVLAGIFLKRLEKNMRMQSCATVVYSWEMQNVKKRRLTYKDLEIKSPYNTYIHSGFPPAPICVPGEDAWLGALYPTSGDYLFFFAAADGHHLFSKTYEEHIAKQNIEKKRRAGS